jgi:hypothetical protein
MWHIEEYGIAIYKFDTLQEAVEGLAELNRKNQCTWDDDRFRIRQVRSLQDRLRIRKA